MWPFSDKRKEFFRLLKSFLDDGHEFRQAITKWIKTSDQITKADLSMDVKKLDRIIAENHAAVHILHHLQKQGRIHFSNKSESRIGNLTNLLQHFLRESEEIERVIVKMKKEIGTFSDRRFLQYKNKLEMLLRSEAEKVEEIGICMRGRVVLSEEKIFSVEQGKLRAELHKNVQVVDYASTGNKMKDEVPIMFLIFYDDCIVGDVIASSYSGGELTSNMSLTYIPGQGYLERAIALALEKKSLKLWISDTSLSPQAERMFERLKQRGNLTVIEERIHGRKHFKVGLSS